MIRSRSLIVTRLSHVSPEVRECVVSGRMAELHDRNYLKESHPVQVAEFALAAGIEDEPAFNWWMSSPLLSDNGLDTISGPVNLGLSSPKL
ncbi:LOW QUALITY PROTEIN: hypothetical protein ACHAW6_002375 [Cyclotella cf. meneghiniana]